MIKYLLFWFPMLLIAVLNGMLREFVLKKYTATLQAYQLSTLTLIILFAVYIAWIVKHFPPVSSSQALLTGIIWMLMTLIFEFGFGLYRGNSWSTMLEDYNLLRGHIWILVLLWVGVAPYVFYRINQS
jgi:hypothetical protein